MQVCFDMKPVAMVFMLCMVVVSSPVFLRSLREVRWLCMMYLKFMSLLGFCIGMMFVSFHMCGKMLLSGSNRHSLRMVELSLHLW